MEDLISRMISGPSFLFLGQNYHRLESSDDLFLSQIIRKYSSKEDQPRNYSDILNTSASSNSEEALAWMANRCAHLPIPAPLEVISGYAWSGIFTSAFDDLIERVFRYPWREIQVISDDRYHPSEPRNRSRLHIWHLFGVINAPDNFGKPPLSETELWQRQHTATIMANRIPDLVTSLGTLIIEGYSSQNDWFSPQGLFPILNSLIENQTHLFSATEEILEDQRFRHLIEKRKLILHNESLAEYLINVEDSGKVKLGKPPEEIEFSQQIRIENKRHSIPRNLWIEISSTAHLIVESQFLPLSLQSEDKQYSDFRNFLFESSYCPPWEGYARGYAFTRDFETQLINEIKQRLHSSQLRVSLVLVHGQTGTGKTVALGNLAFQIQKEGKYPVLFIDRNTRFVKKEVIDRFCEWTENSGAQATLIIWDAMQQPKEYEEMLNFLNSRGRKFLLVGSCYELNPDENPQIVLFETPRNLSSDEQKRFISFLSQFNPFSAEYIEKQFGKTNGSFLARLYRLLPPTRASIRRGVEQELSFYENLILLKASGRTIRPEINTQLGQLLFDAGLIEERPILEGEKKDICKEDIPELQELIGLIMVPGQFNLTCPFELLMHAMGRGISEEFIDILRNVNIFHWSEDLVGNLQIGPRSRFEAELIVLQRIGGPSFEINYAIKLLSAAKISYMFEQQELHFMIDLVKSIGPNGVKPEYYQEYFSQLAECLSRIREEHGLDNPRLMLQESMLFRESAKLPSNHEDRQNLLRKAEKAANDALNVLRVTPHTRMLKSYILVDLASTYGQMAKHASNLDERIEITKRAFQECLFAHSMDSQNLHPIDVIAWTARDLLNSSSDIRCEEQILLQETVLHAFSLADIENYSDENLERLNKRKLELYDVLGQIDLSEQAFKNLLKQGSTAGINIRASKMVDFIYQENTFNDAQRAECEKAYQYIMDFKERIEADSKCLLLSFRLWWIWKTGKLMRSEERTAVPFNNQDWSDCRKLLLQLLNTSDLESNLNLKYLLGLSYYHLRDFYNGVQLFRELESESLYYRRRIIKYHIWSDSKGQPLLFNGTVVSVDDRGIRGIIHVNEIQQKIPFMVYETGRSEIKKGDSLNNFRIAFSMRGPLADFRELKSKETIK